MYTRILVATGGSPWSDAAVAYAIALAAHLGAALRIVTVVGVPQPVALLPEAMGGSELVLDTIESEAQDLVAQAAARATSAGVACKTFCTWGNVPETILRLATDHCKAMVDRAQLRGDLVTETELNLRASDVLPAGSMRRDQFIENIYNRFWTNRVAKVPAMNAVKTQLSELITALSTEVVATTVRSAAISACASALASTVTLVTY